MARSHKQGNPDSADIFAYHEQAAARIAEELEREQAEAEAELARSQGPAVVHHQWPLSARIVFGAFAVTGAAGITGAAAVGVISLRNNSEVQERASRACDASAQVVGAIVNDACSTRVDTAIPLLATNQPSDPEQPANYVYGAIEYVSDAGDAFVTPVKPGLSAGLVVVWDAVANEAYAGTQQSAALDASEITSSGLTRGIQETYEASTVIADQDALYELCMLDNQVRVAALRANSDQFAGVYQVIDIDGQPILDSSGQQRTVSLSGNEISSPQRLLDPHDFAPYTYTSFDEQRIEGAVDGQLKPAFPEIDTKQLIQVDEFGNRLTCPIPQNSGARE